jgi:hypothetical protein
VAKKRQTLILGFFHVVGDAEEQWLSTSLGEIACSSDSSAPVREIRAWSSIEPQNLYPSRRTRDLRNCLKKPALVLEVSVQVKKDAYRAISESRGDTAGGLIL